MTEGKQHKKAKQRIFDLLCFHPRFLRVSKEVTMTFGKNGYPYVADIFCYEIAEEKQGNLIDLGLMPLCIEIDGKHHPPRKNKERDRAFANHGIKTIRFDISSIVGKKAVDDKTILDEIAFHLKPREKLTC